MYDNWLRLITKHERGSPGLRTARLFESPPKTWRKHDADGADARALEREGVAMLIFGDYYRYASIQPTLVARGQEQAY